MLAIFKRKGITRHMKHKENCSIYAGWKEPCNCGTWEAEMEDKNSATKKSLMVLEEEIYKLLYERSTVDGVRLIHEDEWPIKEIAELINRDFYK